MTLKRRRELKALIYLDCSTAILTEVFDGVLNRLENSGEEMPSQSEQEWVHNEIGNIADRFTKRGHLYETASPRRRAPVKGGKNL